jgi:hypothetical protein
MRATQRLNDYLMSLTQRLRWAIVSRASAIVAFFVLVALCGAIAWLAPLGFPKFGVIVSRVVLLSLLLIGAWLFWRPLTRLSASAGAVALEKELPEQDGRIQTFIELQTRKASGDASPMLDLLAEDALKLTHRSPVEQVVTPQRLWIASSVAAVAVMALVYLLTLGADQWGYGSRHLLLGTSLPPEAVPVKQVLLQPGNKTLRRNADLAVQARVQGFKPKDVQLFVRYDEAGEAEPQWERAAMQPARTEDDANYLLTLYALRAPLAYYAVADGIKSAEYQVKVVDVPRIDSLALRYEYPQWTGLLPKVEAKVRDISAVADTQVQLTVRASEPLDQPVLVLDESQIAMSANAGTANSGVPTSVAALTVTKPGRYHLSSRVAGELVALTDDYDIAVVKDEPPTIEIVKPGRDWRATSVEEVPVVIRAQDDFRLNTLEMRYAVNGGEWQSVKLPANTQQVNAKSILQMEELGGKTSLVPGDLVSYYAVTKDRKESVQTDLFMVQVQPFERRFTEGQGGGGGGGAGESEQTQIAERQRDILVATWNLQRAKDQQRRTPQQLKESADMLSGLQEKLADQTNTLVERTRARTRDNNDARVKQFLESLDLAVKAMTPAVAQLSALELPKAVPNEQTALQMLLRAESSFRDIQVSRQQDSQGGNGGGASRDISELYELEMDLAKNKYETEKELTQEDKEPNQQVDAAIAALKELAERQERLAEQQRQQQAPNNADRWKQEQLRREAEELRRKLQELARQQQGQQGSQQANSQSSSQGSSQSSSQQSGQSGSAGSSSKEIDEALKSVESAVQAMRNAEEANKNNRNANNSADQASRALRQAAHSIGDSGTQPADKAVEQLAEQAKQVAAQQRQVEMDIYKAASGRAQGSEPRPRRDGLSPSEAQKLVDAKQQLLKELEKLETSMRATAQAQRTTSPKTAARVGEIVDELSGMNAQSRVARGIVDLERGRADQAMMSEGLITEALQNTASDLRDAAKMATQEAQQRADSVDPETMLNELAQLRRALQMAQAQQANGQQANGQQAGVQSQLQQTQSQQGQGQGQSQQGQSQQSQAQSGQAQSGGGGVNLSPNRQRVGPIGNSAQQRIGDGDGSRNSNGIRDQLTGIQNRIASGTINQADLQALRAVIPQVRRLNGDQLAASANLLASLERLELLALAAKDKSRKQASRAGTVASSAQDGDTAEYYRRLAK